MANAGRLASPLEPDNLRVPTVDLVLFVTYDQINTQISLNNNMPSFHNITQALMCCV